MRGALYEAREAHPEWPYANPHSLTCCQWKGFPQLDPRRLPGADPEAIRPREVPAVVTLQMEHPTCRRVPPGSFSARAARQGRQKAPDTQHERNNKKHRTKQDGEYPDPFHTQKFS